MRPQTFEKIKGVRARARAVHMNRREDDQKEGRWSIVYQRTTAKQKKAKTVRILLSGGFYACLGPLFSRTRIGELYQTVKLLLPSGIGTPWLHDSLETELWNPPPLSQSSSIPCRPA